MFPLYTLCDAVMKFVNPTSEDRMPYRIFSVVGLSTTVKTMPVCILIACATLVTCMRSRPVLLEACVG